jgi:hypothetical protein
LGSWTARRLRALGGSLRAWLVLASALVSLDASAAPRSIEITWRYPEGSAPYAGVALYHAASQANLEAAIDRTRVDLGMPAADGEGVARASVTFDDQRDYYLVLRVYDTSGAESGDSRVGVVVASAPSQGTGPPLGEDFESYRAGQDPEDWEDSASGSTSPGEATLFETTELADATLAFGTSSAASDIHSHFLTSVASAWSSYELTGRIVSQTLEGEAGVTVLSQFPASLAYYRLARSGAAAFALSVRGAIGEIVCAPSASTGVAATPGLWLRFRVRVTRFDGRNRIRAMVYPDGSTPPPGWQVDCWDLKANPVSSGSVGLFASQAPGTYWDDLRVETVTGDGAPDGYQPTTPVPTPPPPSGYTSRNSLVHWWAPGRDAAAMGRDYAARGTPIDVARAARGLGRRDVVDGGAWAFVDLDGVSESLGNKDLVRYGVGDTWSLSAWVRPDKTGKKKNPRYIVDLNGELGPRSQSRIALVLDPQSRFAVEVSDAAGRARALAAPVAISADQLGQRWYHVTAVKAADDSLALYVDGRQVARTDVGVPVQGDVVRAVRVGTRVKRGRDHGFAGGVHSIGIWNAALGAAEVRALWANGNRGFDPR